MKQRELVLARTFHPTTKQLLQITPGSDRKTPFPHSATRFSCPLQQDNDTVATLGNRRWISAAALSHVGLGFGRSCCSQVLLWHFGTQESNPSWLGLFFTPQAVPGGKAGDSTRGERFLQCLGKDTPVICAVNCRVFTLFEAWQIQSKHSRKLPSLSTFTSSWPSVEKTLSSQTALEEAQNLTGKRRKKKNQQNPFIFQAFNCCFGLSRATQRDGLLLKQSLEKNSSALGWAVGETACA